MLGMSSDVPHWNILERWKEERFGLSCAIKESREWDRERGRKGEKFEEIRVDLLVNMWLYKIVE